MRDILLGGGFVFQFLVVQLTRLVLLLPLRYMQSIPFSTSKRLLQNTSVN